MQRHSHPAKQNPLGRVAALAFVLTLALPASYATAAEAGRIFMAVGDVNVVSANGTKRAATKGMALNEGDKIQTGPEGLTQISLSDGGKMSIRSSSELVLTRYQYAKDQPESSNFLVSLVKGGFRSITGLIAKANPASYQIQTPTATIGVRGTDHEPFFIPEPKTGEAPTPHPPGTYDKVNTGQTFIKTPQGLIEIKPGQVGFAPPIKLDSAPPKVLPKTPEFYGEPPQATRKYLPIAHRLRDLDSNTDDLKLNTTRLNSVDLNTVETRSVIQPTTTIAVQPTSTVLTLQPVSTVQSTALKTITPITTLNTPTLSTTTINTTTLKTIAK